MRWMQRGTDEYSRSIMVNGALQMLIGQAHADVEVHSTPVVGDDGQVVNQFDLRFAEGTLAEMLPYTYRLTIEELPPDKAPRSLYDVLGEPISERYHEIENQGGF